MLILVQVHQRIENDNTNYTLCPWVASFQVKASSCPEAIKKVEASEEFKALPGAYVSGIEIKEPIIPLINIS